MIAPAPPQDEAWSRHATNYAEEFLDPFRPGVVNPVLDVLEAIPGRERLTVADLGCGTGPLLPWLLDRFGTVLGVDFAPGMLAKARKRLGRRGRSVRLLRRRMYELDDLQGSLDVAVAINSLVMPDVEEVDRTLRAIRAALKPGGTFAGVLPAMDAILYHTMLLRELGRSRGMNPDDAEAFAAKHGEHEYYDFGFGRFRFRDLDQKFWHPFEVEWRLGRAGFESVRLMKVLYPWDEQLILFKEFVDQPNSWDWGFLARA